MTKIRLNRIEIFFDFWGQLKSGWHLINSIPSEVVKDMSATQIIEREIERLKSINQKEYKAFRLERITLTTKKEILKEIQI